MKSTFNKVLTKKEPEKGMQQSFAETASFGMGGARSLQDAWEKWMLFKNHLRRHTSAIYRQQEFELFRLANVNCALTHEHDS